MGPLGPVSKDVVRIEGTLKYFAMSTRAWTLFLKSSGPKSWTSWIRPACGGLVGWLVGLVVLGMAYLVVDEEECALVLVETDVFWGCHDSE